MHEPTIRMKGAEGEFDSTPSNGLLYRYIGENALYDHVFLQSGIDEHGNREGHPIFMHGFIDNDQVTEVTNFMLRNGYECHINVIEPMAVIKSVHARLLEGQSQDVGEFIPEDWE